MPALSRIQTLCFGSRDPLALPVGARSSVPLESPVGAVLVEGLQDGAIGPDLES